MLKKSASIEQAVPKDAWSASDQCSLEFSVSSAHNRNEAWNTRSTDSKILVTRGDYFINRNHIGFQGCSHSLYFENTLRADVQKMGFLILNHFHTEKLSGMWVTHYACSANFWLPQDKDLTLAPAFQTERLRFILFAVGNFRSECKRVPDKYSEYKLAKSVGVVYVSRKVTETTLKENLLIIFPTFWEYDFLIWDFYRLIL